MSDKPTHIVRYLKSYLAHKEGDLVLMSGEVVEELESIGVISITPEHVGSDFTHLIEYKTNL